MRVQRRHVAAVINGCIVMALPALLVAAGLLRRAEVSGTNVTVRPSGAGVARVLQTTIDTAAVMLPLALLVVWRTAVYAKRWQDSHESGWGGVVEAALTGLALAVVALSHALLTRPAASLPYVVLYGVLGLVIGASVGVLLRASAVLILMFAGRRLPGSRPRVTAVD